MFKIIFFVGLMLSAYGVVAKPKNDRRLILWVSFISASVIYLLGATR